MDGSIDRQQRVRASSAVGKRSSMGMEFTDSMGSYLTSRVSGKHLVRLIANEAGPANILVTPWQAVLFGGYLNSAHLIVASGPISK